MSAKTILQIKNLDISFRTNAGVVHAIRGINLDLQKGETVAIVGESGSGKSVTMKAAVGLLDSNATINSGEILYTYDDGHGQDKTVDLLKLSKKQLRTEYNGQRLAMVFQDPMASLNPRKKVGDIISEGMDTGFMKQGQPTITAHHLFGGVTMSVLHYVGQPEFTDAELADLIVDRFLYGHAVR